MKNKILILLNEIKTQLLKEKYFAFKNKNIIKIANINFLLKYL